MKNPTKIFTVALIILLVCGGIFVVIQKRDSSRPVSPEKKPSITVSIPPLKYIVERLTGNDYEVNVILPAGSSPETYEPTPRQLKELESSPLIVVTGLIDFENSVVAKISSPSTQIIAAHEGIALIEEDGHAHHHLDDGHTHSHSHGVDPHIWTSVTCLKVIAKNIIDNLPERFSKEEYSTNYDLLIGDLNDLDAEIRSKLSHAGTSAFLIYHPALTYFARDYGLEQIQLEQDGKEPSADKLIRTISLAKELGLSKVLYQREFSIRAVETAAKDTGAVPVVIDPLAENILTNLREITEIIAY